MDEAVIVDCLRTAVAKRRAERCATRGRTIWPRR